MGKYSDMLETPAAPAVDKPVVGKYSAMLATPQAYNPVDDMGALDRMASGAGKAYVDMGHGIKQLIMDAGNKIGLVDDKTAAGLASTESERERLDSPLMHDAAGIGANAATNALLTIAASEAGGMIPGAGGLSRMINQYGLPGKAAKAAMVGSAFGATMPVTTEGSRAQNAAISGLGGMVGTGLAAGISASAGALKNKLAQMAAQAGPVVPQSIRDAVDAAGRLGIPLRAENVAGSKVLNGLSAALDYIPLSGAAQSKAAQVSEMNRALSQTIGENTPMIGEALKAARPRLSGEFDRVLSSNSVNLDRQLSAELQDIAQQAQSELSDQQIKPIMAKIAEISTKASQGGVIDGQAAYNIKKSLDRMTRSSDSSLAHWAGEVRGSLMDALSRSLPPDEAAYFAQIRQQYRNMLALEKIVPPNEAASLVTPARLAASRGLKGKDIQEVASVASLIKPKVGDSGTAPRTLLNPVIGGAAGAAAGLQNVIGGALVGRAANAALNSNALLRYLMNRGTGTSAPNALLQMLTTPEATNALQTMGIVGAPVLSR